MVGQRILKDRDDLNKNATPDSWSASGIDPYYPSHELRANLQMSFMINEKKHRDAYYLDMMRQFENTCSLTLISPITLFDYSTEAFLGGGYLRFKKNWEDLHIFQEQFLAYFKEIDASDQESPH